MRQSITEIYPFKPPTGKPCRVFVSHAGEQKKGLVAIIREKLEGDFSALKDQVFVDEISLRGGDPAMTKIYESLREAFVGKQAGRMHARPCCQACRRDRCSAARMGTITVQCKSEGGAQFMTEMIAVSTCSSSMHGQLLSTESNS
jgi:hypothetical protein